MAYFYILKCYGGSYYVGSARNVEERLKRHNRGEIKFTKGRLPVELIYKEYYKKYSEAFRREQQVKSWKKRRAVERLIQRQA